MIKGQSIDNMFRIRDTTPGVQSLLILVIMLLLIYALYQYIMPIVNSKKIDGLKHYEYMFRKALNEREPPVKKMERKGQTSIRSFAIKYGCSYITMKRYSNRRIGRMLEHVSFFSEYFIDLLYQKATT